MITPNLDARSELVQFLDPVGAVPMFHKFDDVFNRIERLRAPNRKYKQSKHLASKISAGRLVLNFTSDRVLREHTSLSLQNDRVNS